MADNLPKKERAKLEKIIANIEYAEAHGDNAEANKLRQRLVEVNEQARAKAAHKAERDAERTAQAGGTTTKVLHGGRKANHAHA